MGKESSKEVVEESTRRVSLSRRMAGWREDTVWLNPLVAVKILVNPHILAMVRTPFVFGISSLTGLLSFIEPELFFYSHVDVHDTGSVGVYSRCSI